MIQRNQLRFTDTCDIDAVQINMESHQLAGFICFNALNQFFFYIFIWHPMGKEKIKYDYNAAISAKPKMIEEEKVNFLEMICAQFM